MHNCCQEEPITQVFNCPGSQRVIKHRHIVKHQHDTVNEYDVIHEHEYNTRDVVRESQVVRHNDCSTHTPNYCGDTGCGGAMPARNWNFNARRW